MLAGFGIDPVECGIQLIEAYSAAVGCLVRQVHRQRCAIFKVGRVVGHG